MELNRRRVVLLAVMVTWSVACTGLYYRWEAVVRHFSIKTGAAVKGPERVPLQNQTSRAGSSSTTQRLPKTRTGGTLHPLNVTSPPVSLPHVEEEEEDELVLRAEAFTGRGSAGGELKKLTVVRQGAVVRRISTSGLGRMDGWGLLSGLVQKGRLDYRDVARYLLKDEYLTSMDREILADDPIQDLSTVASPKHSLLELVGGTRQERKKVRVGHNVTVRIVLRDQRGRAVLKGGHQVRVRMVGRGKPVRLASVDVSDLRNGTYTATLPVLWPGSVEVEAAVQRTREFRRSILSAMAIMKMMNEIVASFISGRKEEVTLCSVIPVVPGYQQLCNLTSLNSDLPWYCGRPATPGLRCRDWALSSHTAFPDRYPLSAAENDVIFHSLPRSGSNCTGDEKLKQTILLTAVQEPRDLKRVSNQTCRPLKAEETWEDHAQRGYWEGSTWRPLAGCPLPRPSGPAVLDCLRDTHFIAIGDSNARRTLGCMQGWTRCPSVPAHKRSRILNNNLHVPITFRCAQRNTRLTWYPHAYPFFTGQAQWSDARVKMSPRRILSALPNTGKYVILIHLYTHFAQVHTYVYAQHVRDAARGVRDLLARNSKVKVFLLGPHAMDGQRFPSLGDFFAERCLRVLKQEFRGLRDRVVLLNTLDMSKAINNCPIHPPLGAIPCQMTISHICPR